MNRISWWKRCSAAFLTIVVAGCTPSPGEQCLESFRAELKDPASGKVINFADSELVYTATNSYGARIQGKALCRESAGKWERDRSGELLRILKLSAQRLEGFNDCRNKGRTRETCAGDSVALRHAGLNIDTDAVNVESARLLGY